MPPVPSRSAMIMLRALAQPARLYSIQTRSSTYHQKLTKRSLSLFATSPRFIPIVYSKQHHLSQQQYRVGFDSRRNPPNRICPFSSTSLQATTLNQVRKQGRNPKRARRGISPAMSNRPEMKGVCLKVGVTKPKKPNSGQRKTAKVRLSTGRIISAYIPGEGRNDDDSSLILMLDFFGGANGVWG